MLIALMAVIPSQFASAEPLSEPVTRGVQQVRVSPRDARAIASLVTSLKDEIRSQGLGNVSTIASAVIANAVDPYSAKALAEAITTAALLVGAESNSDLTQVAASIGEGLSQGSNGNFDSAILAGVSVAVSESVSSDVAGSISATIGSAVTDHSGGTVAPSGVPQPGSGGVTGGTSSGGSTQTSTGGESQSSTGGESQTPVGDDGAEIIVPDSGDAGDTPSVDISVGTGVQD